MHGRQNQFLRFLVNQKIQFYGKGTSSPQFALHFDGSTHHVHNHLCDRHAQTAAFDLINPAVPLPHEGSEHVFLKFRRYSNSIIGYTE